MTYRFAELLFVVLVVLVGACSNGPTSTPAAAPTPTHEGADAPAVADASPSPSTLTIARSRIALEEGRDHHTTFTMSGPDGASLYVVGGTNGWTTITDEILRTPIAPDGSLGAFAAAGRLPEPRAGHTTVIVGRHVIV